jgi:hypothetical protein
MVDSVKEVNNYKVYYTSTWELSSDKKRIGEMKQDIGENGL